MKKQKLILDDAIYIKISKELKQKFKDKCKENGCTPTEKLKDFIKRYVALSKEEEERRKREHYLKHDRYL